MKIRKICIVAAMEGEVKKLIKSIGADRYYFIDDDFPMRAWEGKLFDKEIYIVTSGKIQGVDLVGCEAASLTTSIAIKRFKPDLVINCGTCGGFKDKLDIGDVVIGNVAFYHDHDVPEEKGTVQSYGDYKLWERSWYIADELGLKVANVSTGSSLINHDEEISRMVKHGGDVKDMEGAAVAFVCYLSKVPCMLVKSVTDHIDSTASTYDTFKKNFKRSVYYLFLEMEKILSLL